MVKQQIGLIGMGVMGCNLALNLVNHGYSVSIFNRSREKTDKIIKENMCKQLIPCYQINELVFSLKKPRYILLMLKAGNITDEMIISLIPYLDKNDILIDGGNSYFKDTIRRNQELFQKGIHFVGMGISGGHDGALKGPSIMVGGQKKVFDVIEPIFKKIAAKVNGEACLSYIGSDGAGHYVKMVHNAIEYCDMQIIAEVYAILKNVLNLNNEELADVFSEWNTGELNSYLIQITADIFRKKDSNGISLIDLILDVAVSKGTGKWSSQNALELEIPSTLVSESLFARYISCLKEQRLVAAKILTGPFNVTFTGNKETFIEKIRKALYVGKIIAYSQGFYQLKVASDKYKWQLNYADIAKNFRSGCIIRAHFLQKITNAYCQNPFLVNLMLSPYFSNIIDKYQGSLRDVVCVAIKYGIPIPTLTAAVAYYDSYRTSFLTANLIQAQRDYFGAHTYFHTEKKTTMHTEWI
ncbi:MAG: decarboxylating NADP(+)-dependent phosphogluconate dehydrogenase [Arsenophonus sp.]|nr:MAG: decarboxylating NADP(+)-dependent phosphogluconate dehydrogenase [Arsenophonus sp.]